MTALTSLLLAAPGTAQQVAQRVNAEMVEAATHWLASLTVEQRAAASVDFASPERHDWHFVPRERRGLSLKAMTAAQKPLAYALLATGLSQRGLGKALSIMSIEEVLREIEKGHGPVRDPELFYFTIFGRPGGTEPWGWRVEGHHLSLNFASVGTTLPSVTPSFFGSNPARVPHGPHAGWRVLAQEEELGRQLVHSLDEEQRRLAILDVQAPSDILNVPGRRDFTRPEGLPYRLLAPAQSTLLTHLIREYLERHRSEIAAAEWSKIEKAGLQTVHFAWAGGVEPGQGHYYRVQGKTFVLEYDNTQNGANHVHTVWRDLENDFGADLLKQHYAEGHSH
jgi:hypothetical protein